MKRLAIFGASGHGRVVADTALECGWQEVVFFDDRWPDLKANGPWNVDGNLSALIQNRNEYQGVTIAVGDNFRRGSLHRQIEVAGARLVSIIHPAAIVSRYAAFGAGAVVFAGVVVNAGAVIGRGVILNTGCSVDHDCVLDDFVHISPGARLAGSVTVGAYSWVGLGAAVRQGITIGREVIVGAGAVVIEDVDRGSTVVGIPAKPIVRSRIN